MPSPCAHAPPIVPCAPSAPVLPQPHSLWVPRGSCCLTSRPLGWARRRCSCSWGPPRWCCAAAAASPAGGGLQEGLLQAACVDACEMPTLALERCACWPGRQCGLHPPLSPRPPCTQSHLSSVACMLTLQPPSCCKKMPSHCSHTPSLTSHFSTVASTGPALCRCHLPTPCSSMEVAVRPGAVAAKMCLHAPSGPTAAMFNVSHAHAVPDTLTLPLACRQIHGFIRGRGSNKYY